MQDRQDEVSSEGLEQEVMDSLGNPEQVAADEESAQDVKEDLPAYAKQKLGMQEKRHKKAMREVRQQLDEMRAQLGSRPESMNTQNPVNNYSQPDMQQSGGNDIIQQAVAAALRAQADQQKKAQDAEKMQYVHKQYQDLQDELDNGSDKYEDFDDVVRHPNVPFTEAMRDATLLLPNKSDVLYKLAKNPDEFKRIRDLHPIEQAKEMVKLSFALMSGGNEKSSQPIKTMGNIKSNPVSNSSAQVNEKTPIGELRRKMKAGWK